MSKLDPKLLAVGIGLVVLVLVVAFNHDATQNLIHILQLFPPILYVPIPSGKEPPKRNTSKRSLPHNKNHNDRYRYEQAGLVNMLTSPACSYR